MGEYVRHGQRQSDLILDCAEDLFLRDGVDVVSISDIARASGVSRPTVYRYFNTKEDIFWAVYYRLQSSCMKELTERLTAAPDTYHRFVAYVEVMYKTFDGNERYLLAQDIFMSKYIRASEDPHATFWDNPYNTSGIRPGGIMRYFVDFHDGSVKGSLDPTTTVVSFAYGVSSCMAVCFKSRRAIPVKYGVDPVDVLRTQMTWMLDSVRA
ncbi:TetR/AcrR family transcriptional regulator [Bifidobacterium simiiventris]|uniref:TetR/AcrR family transcriptional regulator n=1 Tax=Bifidobacterium simiiventris TaxID=2834434 RepID=UPI001C595980|nr:TetR/AcrR family transcriptional regulator [Bifidobacterium simiiventris]MBW3077781.1 TetR/AcrR family transcriptional regulator [Bifidobacterium simiiventris]